MPGFPINKINLTKRIQDMPTFRQYINESAGTTLYVFDIDDTLFRTSAKINVVKDGKVVRSLSSSEFNTYKPKEGESYDFMEFGNAEKFRKQSEPIQPMIDTLNRIHAKIKMNLTPGSKIIMNTARGDFDERDNFLATFRDHDIDIDDIHVHRAGVIRGTRTTAQKKLVFIRSRIASGGYSTVIMYDDAPENLNQFLTLRKEFPDVKFYAYIVKHDGRLVHFDSTKESD